MFGQGLQLQIVTNHVYCLHKASCCHLELKFEVELVSQCLKQLRICTTNAIPTNCFEIQNIQMSVICKQCEDDQLQQLIFGAPI